MPFVWLYDSPTIGKLDSKVWSVANQEFPTILVGCKAKDSNHWTWGGVLAVFCAQLASLQSVCTASFQNLPPSMVSNGRCAFQGACGKESHAIRRRRGNSSQFCWPRGCSLENSYHKNCDAPTFTTKPGNFTTIQCVEWLEKPNVRT